MATLLLYEKSLGANGSEERRDSSEIIPYKSRQWSHQYGFQLDTALMRAVLTFDEDPLCTLLEIARPTSITESNSYGETALNAAAERGFQKVTQILLEGHQPGAPSTNSEH